MDSVGMCREALLLVAHLPGGMPALPRLALPPPPQPGSCSPPSHHPARAPRWCLALGSAKVAKGPHGGMSIDLGWFFFYFLVSLIFILLQRWAFFPLP